MTFFRTLGVSRLVIVVGLLAVTESILVHGIAVDDTTLAVAGAIGNAIVVGITVIFYQDQQMKSIMREQIRLLRHREELRERLNNPSRRFRDQ